MSLLPAHRNLLVDLQANGATLPGLSPTVVDFSNSNLTLDEVLGVAALMKGKGIEIFLPTIITCDPQIALRNVALIAEAMERPQGENIGGIHLEGPYLKVEGAHPKDYLKDPDIGEFRKLFDAAKGRIALTTVAPERNGMPEYISALVEMGVVVSLGHHEAETPQIEDAFDAGATAVTHAGNAWGSTKRSRKDDGVLAMLALAKHVMFIPDGKHLTAQFIKHLAGLCTKPNQLVAVSDCSPLAGASLGKYQIFGGREFEVVCEGRETFTRDLSGSYLTMEQIFQRLLTLTHRGRLFVPVEQAVMAATASPFDLIRLPLRRILPAAQYGKLATEMSQFNLAES